MLKLRHFVRDALSGGIPARSLLVAVIVGTILNLINQGDALFGHAAVNWFKLLLTYFVPYAVCTYGAVSGKVRSVPQRNAPARGETGHT